MAELEARRDEAAPAYPARGDSGSSMRSWTGRGFRRLLVTALVASLLLEGCRGAVPIEEARKITATFDNIGLVPPARPEEDPRAILQQQRERPEAEAEERAQADASAPVTSDLAVLARFYHQRGIAAGGAGRMRQRVEDLTVAVLFAAQVRDPNWDPGPFVLDLARAELHDKRRPAAARRLEAFVASKPWNRDHLITAAYFLVSGYTDDGYVDRAERALRQGMTVWSESLGWPNRPHEAVTVREAMMQLAQGHVRSLKGEFPGAIAAYRQAVAVMGRDAVASAQNDLAEVAAVPSAPGVAGVRVWEIMSRRRGPRGG
jgi:hypothetical protein